MALASHEASCRGRVRATISASLTDRGGHVGRTPNADADHGAFALAFDALGRPRAPGENGKPLDVDDVRRLLEASSRRGSLTAQRALLAELQREQKAEDSAETLRGMGLDR